MHHVRTSPSLHETNFGRIRRCVALAVMCVGVNSAHAQPLNASVPADEKASDAQREKLEVQVLGPDGEPMAEINVHVSIWSEDPFRPARDHFTDDDGRVEFELPADIEILRVWVKTRGHVPLFRNWDIKRNPEISIPREVTYQLANGTVIGGVVRDEAGRPIVGAVVEVSNQSPSPQPDGIGESVVTTWLATEGGALLTDESGRWTLDNVPAGDDVDVRIKLSHPDFIDDRSWGDYQRAQHVTMQALRDQSAILVMRKGVEVSGVVADPDGNAVADAVVMWGDDQSMNESSHQAHTSDDGIYRFEQLPPGKLALIAIAEGRSPETVEVEAAHPMPPVDFTLNRGPALRVRFVDVQGNPVPEARVQIDQWDKFRSEVRIIGGSVLNKFAPHRADGNGYYEWPSAPEGAVTYLCSREGFATTQATLTADGTGQTVVMHRTLVIAGTVTDAVTGKRVESFLVPQVHYFRPNFLYVNRSDSVRGEAGRFRMEFTRTDIDHGVRIEAPGYRTHLLGPWKIGQSVDELDVRLEPADPIHGVVVDLSGKPVAEANVCLATHTQSVDIINHDFYNDDMFLRKSDAAGRFEFPAQYEPYALIAVHDTGYAEVMCEPSEQPGELRLAAWSKVAGRLVQDGQPIADQQVRYQPIRPRSYPHPRISDAFWSQTDAAGRYEFKRVPPGKASLDAYLTIWEESPLRSSPSVPLDLKPGEGRQLDLGGEGAAISGRVRLTGQAARQIELHYSLNYLLRMAPGIEPPPALARLGLDWRDGWSHSWTSSEEGQAYQRTLHHYFVKLDSDGSFRISGVPAGEYQLAFKIYEPPTEGCLVYPVGTHVKEFSVTQEDVNSGELNLGEVDIVVALGPKPGDMMPDLQFTTADGTAVRLSELRGGPVLLDFWASWCGPCIAALPQVRELHNAHAGDDLVVLGMNLDADQEQARRFIDDRGLPWKQVLLGDWADTTVPEQLGISSVPAYFLIDERGVLIERSVQLEAIVEKLNE